MAWFAIPKCGAYGIIAIAMIRPGAKRSGMVCHTKVRSIWYNSDSYDKARSEAEWHGLPYQSAEHMVYL